MPLRMGVEPLGFKLGYTPSQNAECWSGSLALPVLADHRHLSPLTSNQFYKHVSELLCPVEHPHLHILMKAKTATFTTSLVPADIEVTSQWAHLKTKLILPIKTSAVWVMGPISLLPVTMPL